MPREKQDYRENLARIEAAFPGGEMLNIKQVGEITGYRDYRTIKRRFEFDRFNRISKVKLARLKSCAMGFLRGHNATGERLFDGRQNPYQLAPELPGPLANARRVNELSILYPRKRGPPIRAAHLFGRSKRQPGRKQNSRHDIARSIL